jgi:hypothetical protein
VSPSGVHFNEWLQFSLFHEGDFPTFGRFSSIRVDFGQFLWSIFLFLSFFQFSVTVYSHGGRGADD